MNHMEFLTMEPQDLSVFLALKVLASSRSTDLSSEQSSDSELLKNPSSKLSAN